MKKRVPKRKIKDSVFTDLFKDKKHLLQLYRALHPEDDAVTEDDLADITLKHVLVDADYNDLGFSVGSRLMVLVESQSTWTLNIVIRALMYLIQTYHDYLKRTDQNLYGSKKVTMPRPELYLIYTGERKNVPESISLSRDFFDGAKTSIDAEVRVLYHEDEKNIIGQYIIFCRVYNEQRKRYGNTKQAVEETIRICRDRNVLRGYLESREQEVINIMMTLFDDDQILKAYTKEIEEQTARQTAERMIRKGKMTLEEIADYVPALSLEELKELEAEIMHLV